MAWGRSRLPTGGQSHRIGELTHSHQGDRHQHEWIPMAPHRTSVCLWLGYLLLGPANAQAQAGVPPEVRQWVSALVAKVQTAENADGIPRNRRRPEVVDLRIVIGADGALRDVSVEGRSGSRTTDERAIAAVRSAAPFAAPPDALLTPEGTVDLRFPINLTQSR